MHENRDLLSLNFYGSNDAKVDCISAAERVKSSSQNTLSLRVMQGYNEVATLWNAVAGSSSHPSASGARSNRSHSEISRERSEDEEREGDIVGGCLLDSGGVGIVLRVAVASTTTTTTSVAAATAAMAAAVVVAALQVGARNKGSLRGRGAVVRQFPGCSGVSEGVARRHGGRAGRSRGPRHDEASRRQ